MGKQREPFGAVGFLSLGGFGSISAYGVASIVKGCWWRHTRPGAATSGVVLVTENCPRILAGVVSGVVSGVEGVERKK